MPDRGVSVETGRPDHVGMDRGEGRVGEGMTRTRCKFTCISKREYQQYGTPGPVYDYEFAAVTNSKTPENAQFWKWTPSGKLNVSVVQDGTFVVGQDYYVDLTQVVPEGSHADANPVE